MMLCAKWLSKIGLYSFSLYLWQQVFYKLLQHWRDTGFLSPAEGLAARPVPVALAFTFAVNLLSYRLVEAPARRTINRKWEAWRRRPLPRNRLPIRSQR